MCVSLAKMSQFLVWFDIGFRYVRMGHAFSGSLSQYDESSKMPISHLCSVLCVMYHSLHLCLSRYIEEVSSVINHTIPT